MFRPSTWFSQRFNVRLAALFSVAISGFCHSVVAAPISGVYSPLTISVSVIDRNSKPVSGIALHFKVDLDGQSAGIDGQSAPDIRHLDAEAVTGVNGVATLTIAPACRLVDSKAAWFRGHVRAFVEPVSDPEIGVAALEPMPLHVEEELPAAHLDHLTGPTIRVFERPNRIVDGFPIWSALDGHDSRIVVLLEGFDLYNRISASENMRLIGEAADALRGHGISVLVVNYPDSHLAPDNLAPLAARAVETAARISGHKVALAGLSMGGLVGRWALCAAEAAGRPLPVNLFLMLDTPNRGVNLNLSLQAMILRYGMKADENAMRSDAARCLLCAVPGETKWKRVGIGPETSRLVPSEVTPDTHFHDDFLRKLESLNDHHGYPKACRVVAIANSSRQSPKNNAPLLHLWLPLDFSWTLAALPADHAAGSTLPPYYCDRFRVERIFGIAGACLSSAPTFVSGTSALDADPGQTPPFDAWFARPDNLAAVPHDEPDAGAARFAVRELLTAVW